MLCAISRGTCGKLHRRLQLISYDVVDASGMQWDGFGWGVMYESYRSRRLDG